MLLPPRAVLYRCTTIPPLPPDYALGGLVRYASQRGYCIVDRAVDGPDEAALSPAQRPAWAQRIWPRLSPPHVAVLVVHTLADLGSEEDQGDLLPELAGLGIEIDSMSRHRHRHSTTATGPGCGEGGGAA